VGSILHPYGKVYRNSQDAHKASGIEARRASCNHVVPINAGRLVDHHCLVHIRSPCDPPRAVLDE
jgi:hypothetical protein